MSLPDENTRSAVNPQTPEEINFRDVELQKCPYAAYRVLRDQAPVWRDPDGQYQVTRYDLLREVLRDQVHFKNGMASSVAKPDQARVARIRQLFEEKGWLPSPAIRQMDKPEHPYMRALFQKAFHPSKIAKAEPLIAELCDQLIDSFITRGECDWVKEFATPLPLTVILKESGIPLADAARIKQWTEAYIRHHLSFMQSEAEDIRSAELEIERQHYFQPIFERLRARPDGSMLSDIVNAVIPETGQRLTPEQLHAMIGQDLLVGGFETTTSALASGMKLLIENPSVWEQLKRDPEAYLPVFVEEVLRLEAPAQALYRVVCQDVEIGGVAIPTGAPVAMRFGAANRDERQFPNPDAVDLTRKNAGSHVTFGMGLHTCIGAPLARRELTIAFRTVLRRFASVRFQIGHGPSFQYLPSKSLRALVELRIAFTPAPYPNQGK